MAEYLEAYQDQCSSMFFFFSLSITFKYLIVLNLFLPYHFIGSAETLWQKLQLSKATCSITPLVMTLPIRVQHTTTAHMLERVPTRIQAGISTNKLQESRTAGEPP